MLHRFRYISMSFLACTHYFIDRHFYGSKGKAIAWLNYLHLSLAGLSVRY